MKKLKPGTIVVLDQKEIDAQPGENSNKKAVYGRLGYGDKHPKLFVYLMEIISAPGHCILVSLHDQKIETMWHCDLFREARDEEM